MEEHFTEALMAAERDSITGKDVTPYLLDKIFQITDGVSLETNIALVLNNARVASDIAVELAQAVRG